MYKSGLGKTEVPNDMWLDKEHTVSMLNEILTVILTEWDIVAFDHMNDYALLN